MHRFPVPLTAVLFLAVGTLAHVQAAPVVPSAAATAAKAVDPGKEKTIRQLLEVTGTSKLMQQMTNQMFASMQTSVPDVPPEMWARMRKRFKADEMITLLIPVYDKYYSQEDLDGLVAFYQSPLGRKVIATLPQVSQESMEIGQAWGRKQAQAVLEEIEQEKKTTQNRSKTKATTL